MKEIFLKRIVGKVVFTSASLGLSFLNPTFLQDPRTPYLVIMFVLVVFFAENVQVLLIGKPEGKNTGYYVKRTIFVLAVLISIVYFGYFLNNIGV